MKKRSLTILTGFLLLGLIILSNEKTFGQSDSKKANEKGAVNSTKSSAPKRPEPLANVVNSRVLNVLRETADDAKSWDDAKTSAQVQARIADIVWDVDPNSAETYLTKAWEKSKDVKEGGEKPSEYRNSSARVEASREVLLVARKRSPELAEKWLAELTDSAEEDFKKRNNGMFDDRTARSAVLLQMAMQTAAANPEAAASFATESLRDGISFGLQTVLLAIQEKNPELAQNVVRAALQRLQTAGIQSPNEILVLYSYVYLPGLVFAASDSANQGQRTISLARNRPQIKAMAELNPGLAVDFLRVAAGALLGLPYPADEKEARQQTDAINTILYRIGNSLPQQSQALREKLTSILASTNYAPAADSAPEGSVQHQKGEKVEDYRSRVIDNLVEKAEKESNPLRRDVLYAQAALKTNAEMFERGKSIAAKIQDKDFQEQITNFVVYRKTLDEIKLDNFDSAYKILGKNSNNKQKTASLIVGAIKLKKQKDAIRSGYWLSDAEKLFRKAEKSDEDWIKIGFGLTSAETDKNDSSDAFRRTAKLIDEEVKVEIGDDEAPLASGFSGIDFINFLNDTNGFSLKSAVSSFNKEDFEDALSSLKTIKNPKIRGFGILALCEKYLKDSQKSLRDVKQKAAD